MATEVGRKVLRSKVEFHSYLREGGGREKGREGGEGRMDGEGREGGGSKGREGAGKQAGRQAGWQVPFAASQPASQPVNLSSTPTHVSFTLLANKNSTGVGLFPAGCTMHGPGSWEVPHLHTQWPS